MATDFFQRQDTAKRKTQVLVLGTIGGTIGIILVVYLLSALVFLGASSQTKQPARLWDPALFAIVAVATTTVVGGATGFKALQLRSGGEAVALSLGGRQIPPNTRDAEERRLLNVVEEMAIASGVPAPKTFILEDEDGINAFAAGHTPDDAAVAVTRGLLRSLNRDELQGVVAHEFSHILNGDMRINVRLISLVSGIMVLSLIGQIIMRSAPHSSGSRDSKNSGAAFALFGLGLLIIGYIGAIFGRLMQSAVSRQREFLADASAVQFTRNPDGIGGALKKIGALSQGSTIENPHAAEVGHLFFGNAGGWSFLNAFATHPPLEQRIRAIDPNWDGEYPVIDTAAIAEEANESQSQSRTQPPPIPFPMPFPGAGGMGQGGSARIPLHAGFDANAFGAPSPARIRQAQGIMREVPNDVADAARDPFSARAVIYALLLNKDDKPKRRQIEHLRGAIDSPAFREFQKLAPQVEHLHPALRLPIVELALPALGTMTPDQYQEFRGHIQTLVDADATVDLFEYMIMRVVVRVLDRQVLDEAEETPEEPTESEARQACRVLFSGLARVSEAQRQEAFETALDRLGLDPEPLLPTAQTNLDALHAALHTLEGAESRLKRRILEASIASVQTDGSISVDEAELVRIIAAALNYPIPPITADAA